MSGSPGPADYLSSLAQMREDISQHRQKFRNPPAHVSPRQLAAGLQRYHDHLLNQYFHRATCFAVLDPKNQSEMLDALKTELRELRRTIELHLERANEGARRGRRIGRDTWAYAGGRNSEMEPALAVNEHRRMVSLLGDHPKLRGHLPGYYPFSW